MEIIERYIYAVVKRLPAKQRDDIEKDLKSLIDDMLAERTGSGMPDVSDAEAVLTELGDPALMAEKYRDTKRYLIGPELFETYIMVLKIVAIAVTLGMSMAMAISVIVTQPTDSVKSIASSISAVFSSVVSALAWVTIIFAIIERSRMESARSFSLKAPEAWKPSSLPKIPVKSAVIPRGESIVGIIFNLIFIILINSFAADLSFVFAFGDVTVIPLFNPDSLAVYLPIINVLLCLAILKECAKLMVGRWTLPLALGNMALNVLSLIFLVIFFSDMSVWSSEFLNTIVKNTPDADMTFLRGFFWGGFSKMMIGIFTFAYILDSIVNLVKALRGRLAT